MVRSGFCVPFLFAPVLLLATAAWSDDRPADDAAGGNAPAATFYATATVRERPLDGATAAVTVVGREDLEKEDTILGALEQVAGLSFVSGATRGGSTLVQIRGGDPNFTQVLIDGVPVNDGTYQQGEVFNFEALPAAAFERAEVVRGPLSAYYGATGLAGAIQLFTRQGDGPPRGEAELQAGDAGAYRASGSFAGGGERADAFVLALAEGEERRIADESYELASLQGRVRLRPNDGLSLQLAARLADWQADDYPEGSGGPRLGSGELRAADHREQSASLQASRGGAASGQRASLAFYRHRMDRDSPAIFPVVPAAIEASRFTRVRLGFAANGQAGEKFEWSAGADGEREEGVNSSLLFSPFFPDGGIPGDYDLARESGGLHAGLLVRRATFTAEAGARADFPSGQADQLSPRLGLAWQPGGGATRIHASAGRAFKLPSFFALASPPELGGNPLLEPEKSRGGDLGIAHRFAGGLELDLTFFRQRFENLVDFDFATFLHVNRAAVDSRGAELSASYRPGPRLAAGFSALYQEVEDAATGERLRHRPRLSASLRLTRQLAERWEVEGRWRYVSESYDEEVPLPGRLEVDGYHLVAAAANYRLSPAWRLDLRLDNLTGERYETLAGFPGAGRSWRLGVRFSPGRS